MFSSYLQRAGEYLNIENASDLVERARSAASDAAERAQKVSETVQAEYRRTFVELDCEISHISSDLHIMEFPSVDKIARLATRLNADFAQRMLIYNMSEKTYDTSQFRAEVVDVAFRGLPAPPLELLMELCLSVHSWLSSDPGNVLVVHCFSGFSRSAVFLSCFLAFRGDSDDPVDALHEVCHRLRLRDAVAVNPSQRRYLTYFQRCQEGFTPIRTPLRLLGVQLKGGVPRFEAADAAVTFRPFVEVWNHGELVWSSLVSGASGAAPPRSDSVEAESGKDSREAASGSDGGRPASLPPGFGAGDACVPFQTPPDTMVSGDVLIRVRHMSASGSCDTVLRLAFHTAFVPPEGLQLGKHELDTACNDARVPEDFFLDLAFQRVESDEGSQVSPVFQKAREVSSELKEELRQRRQREAEARAAEAREAARKQQEESERDSGEALAATLQQSSGPAQAQAQAQVPDDAAELRRALAAAAADDEAADEAAEGPFPAAASPSRGGSKGQPETSPQNVSSSPRTGADSPGGSASSEGRSGAAHTEPVHVEAKADNSEIDTLFSEFDAALESVGGGPSSSVTGTEEAARRPAAPTGPAVPAAAQPASGTQERDAIFGDVDDFLKELEG
mmetsp:Transcript_42576/g.92750  ORF Transcript_42576/g.92750 Transcript_42576/m.92750 type:complete len:620 (-) Transcript_42576:70-1929(-)